MRQLAEHERHPQAAVFRDIHPLERKAGRRKRFDLAAWPSPSRFAILTGKSASLGQGRLSPLVSSRAGRLFFTPPRSLTGTHRTAGSGQNRIVRFWIRRAGKLPYGFATRLRPPAIIDGDLSVGIRESRTQIRSIASAASRGCASTPAASRSFFSSPCHNAGQPSRLTIERAR